MRWAKSEIRNPKSERSPKARNPKSARAAGRTGSRSGIVTTEGWVPASTRRVASGSASAPLRTSDFGLRASFGLRFRFRIGPTRIAGETDPTNFAAPFVPMPEHQCQPIERQFRHAGFTTRFRKAVTSLMCACSKKLFNAAGDRERDVPSGQLELHSARGKVRAVKHRHRVPNSPLPPAIPGTRCATNARLLMGVLTRHLHRLGARFPRRHQVLRVLAHVGSQSPRWRLGDLWRAAVVGFNAVGLRRVRVARRELEDVLEIRPAPP